MKIKLPWSDWLVDQGKKRKKIEAWQIAHVSLEEELNLELAKEHSNSLKGLEKDLNYLSEEAKSSLVKFKQLGNHQEEEFEVYLDKFVNDI